MTAYYNDNDPYCCQWLRNLIAAGHVTPGDVDERPIQEVRPDELRGYERVHAFAGIAGWELALSLAGWDGRPVWTGSCPCQPFSQAGQRKGEDDERHLWPAFHRLIAECRPSVVFGEQVAGPDGLRWLSGVRADLEGDGYAVGAADLCAAGVGAPHIRQRLWWVGHTTGERRQERGPVAAGESAWSVAAGGGVGDAGQQGLPERSRPWSPGADGGDPWEAAVPTGCADGRFRRVEPGVQPLAHGVPGRVGQLRAYGNAICPQVAAVFVRAFMECRP